MTPPPPVVPDVETRGQGERPAPVYQRMPAANDDKRPRSLADRRLAALLQPDARPQPPAAYRRPTTTTAASPPPASTPPTARRSHPPVQLVLVVNLPAWPCLDFGSSASVYASPVDLTPSRLAPNRPPAYQPPRLASSFLSTWATFSSSSLRFSRSPSWPLPAGHTSGPATSAPFRSWAGAPPSPSSASSIISFTSTPTKIVHLSGVISVGPYSQQLMWRDQS